MILSNEQTRAVQAFHRLVRGQAKRLRVGGYAGTGKSTIIQAICEHYADDADTAIAVCTPTGKAAHVLRSKGIEDACTLHSLLYTPRGTDRHGEVIFARSGAPMPDIVIVDEASMLTTQLVHDLERDVAQVAYFGDHGQLEPIGDDPGLMRDLDVRLETVHRQVADSPIIQFAHHVRCGQPPRTFGRMARVQDGWSADLVDFDVIIVGYNRSRIQVNAWVRKRRGFSGPLPQPGEQIICLRNDRDYAVWNGMTATVTDIDPHRRCFTVETDDGPRHDVIFDPEQFGAPRVKPYEKPRKGRIQPTLWDFGYAVTCHKYQGSEAQRVAVVDEVASSWSGERWRYTAATRAKEELRWVYK